MTKLGWMLIAFGALIVAFLRFVGLDLTEGQLLVQYFPWWIVAIGCVAGGVVIICISEKHDKSS